MTHVVPLQVFARFREWVALPEPDRRRWQDLLAEAREHAAVAAS